LIGKVRFVSLGHDSQTRTPFYLVSSEFTETGDEFSDGLLVKFMRPELQLRKPLPKPEIELKINDPSN